MPRKKRVEITRPTKTEEPQVVQVVRCSLCGKPLQKGESRYDHIDKFHVDLFKVETYYVSTKAV